MHTIRVVKNVLFQFVFFSLLLKNTRAGTEEDKCVIDGYCSQICENVNGTATCSCVEGYNLQDNKCVANRGQPKILILTNNRIEMNDGNNTRVYNHTKSSPGEALAYDYVKKCAYWRNPDSVSPVIMRWYPHSTWWYQPWPYLKLGLVDPVALAADWMQGNLYVADSGLRKILACGSYSCSSLNDDVDPTSIALDPRNGFMYWASSGENGSIHKQGMDGSNCSIFVPELNSPNGLTLDPVLDVLYWTAIKDFNCIEKIKLDGTGRKVILQDPEYSPQYLSIFEDTIYWSNNVNNTVYTCNKFNGGNVSVFLSSGGNLVITHDVITARYSKLRMGHNPCSYGSCYHPLNCLIAPEGRYTCGCPVGQSLKSDNRSCSVDKMVPRMFGSIGSRLFSILPDYIGSNFEVEKFRISTITAVAYDWNQGMLYVSYLSGGITALNETFYPKEIIKGAVGRIVTLCYDYVGENLYWLDAGISKIEVCTTEGSFRKVLMKVKALGMALNPDEGIMYVAVELPTSYIGTFNMDGTRREKLEGTDGATYISLNSITGDLFWISLNNGTIMRYNTTKKESVVVIESPPKAVAVASSRNYVFWLQDDPYLRYSYLSNTEDHQSISLYIYEKSPFRYLTYVHPVNSKKICQNTPCSQLCLVIPQGYKCACSDGFSLHHDNHTCVAKTCKKYQFRCKNGDCIPLSEKCNHIWDCIDGSDEDNCNGTSICSPNQFRCENGRCIALKYQCDEDNDCGDFSDERDCNTTTPPPCPYPQFRCNDTKCLPLRLVCDQTPNCFYGEDEINCDSRKCPPSYHRCDNGQCREEDLWCDGVSHCVDGSDEKNCTEPTTPDTCEGRFRCQSGLCIETSKLCDGVDDCPGKEDEGYCPNNTCPPDGMRCNNGQCIDKVDICDGEKDCPDEEDEKDCPTKDCSSEEFRCLSGKCIFKQLRCDGIEHCDDGSDEYKCPYTTTSTLAPSCGKGEFRCLSGQCIKETKVCDGKPDCLDNSDESGSCNVSCGQDNGGCSQICKRTLQGPVCSCNTGYYLTNDNKTCLDIDECSIKRGNCRHYCYNTKGSYYCTCATNYSPVGRQNCKFSVKQKAYYSFVSEGKRQLYYRRKSRLMGSETSVRGMDFDIRRQSVIWADSDKGSIVSFKVKSEKVKVLIGGLVAPQTVAYDWIAQNYYISSQEGIHVCGNSSEGVVCTTLKNSTMTITSIALAADKGLMFYSTSSFCKISPKVNYGEGSSRIVRMDMDGSALTILLEEKLFCPADIAIDHVLETIYWGDPVRQMIESLTFDGKNRETVVRKGLSHPFSLIVGGKFLYWNDWKRGHLMRCGMTDCSNSVMIRNISRRATWLNSKCYQKWITTALQPPANNPCSEKNCSHLCLLSRSGASCRCRDGYVTTNRGCSRGFCSADYCLNSGTCEETNNGITCRCSSGFDGERCDRSRTSNISFGIIVGIVIAVIIVVGLAAAVIFWRKIFIAGRSGATLSFCDLKRRHDGTGILREEDEYDVHDFRSTAKN